MAQNATTSYNTPNRYLLPHNYLQQHQHGSSPHQSQQQQQHQQSSGYFCGNQLMPPQSAQHQQHQSAPPPSQQHSRQHQQQPSYMMGCYPQNPNGWAGIPLISTAPRRTKRNCFAGGGGGGGVSVAGGGCGKPPRILIPNNSSEYDENAMTRLAMHAHGAPLILAGRYRNRVQKRGDSKQQPALSSASTKSNEASSSSLDSGASSKSDNSTTGSDENSPNAVGNQETCLPRIIKPRKRRKKDRKPQNTTIVCMPDATTAQTMPPGINPDHSHLSHVKVTREPLLPSVPPRLMRQPMLEPAQKCRDTVVPPPAETMSSSAFSNNHQQDSLESIFKLQSPLDDESTIGSCCCRICDPSCRIWAFPLRRSCSDNTAELELHRLNKDVGVIGSNRSASAKNATEWRGLSKVDSNRSLFRNGSFSDSGDSGCDLLNGISFADDPIFFNGSAQQISTSPIDDDRNFIDFPTAETLLTESINEISKKLMETVDLRSDIFSSDSSSVFSDSVLSDDMLFNIENLARSCNAQNPSSVALSSSSGAADDLFNDLAQQYPNKQHLISPNCNSNSNNNVSNVNCNYLLNGISGDNNGSSNSNNQCNNNINSNFVMFHEKDRENEIFNCLDMVWSRSNDHFNASNNNHHQHHHGGFTGGGIGSGSNHLFGGIRQLLPIEEQRIQLQTNG